MPVLGFIGLGAMGGRMAKQLLAEGYEIVVHDKRPEAVAPLVHAGASPAEDANEVGE